MFNIIVRASLNNRLFVLIGALAIAFYGAFAASRLSVDVFPDLNRPTVTLMTEAEGLAPEEVEQLVTFPIETAMNGMPGVTRVRSVSGVGLSIVYVEFGWGDRHLPRAPAGGRAPVAGAGAAAAQHRPADGPDLLDHGRDHADRHGRARQASPMKLREIADFVLRPRLLTIPGVAQVIPIGGEVRQYRVVPDPRKMATLDVSLAADRESGAAVRRQHRRRLRRPARARISDPQYRRGRPGWRIWRNLVVAYRNGQPMHLEPGGRRRVRRAHQARRRRLHGPAGSRPGDTEAARRRHDRPHPRDRARAARAAEDACPRACRSTNVQFRQATFIEGSIANVQRVLLEALAVVAVVLFAVPAQLAHDVHLAHRHPSFHRSSR